MTHSFSFATLAYARVERLHRKTTTTTTTKTFKIQTTIRNTNLHFKIFGLPRKLVKVPNNTLTYKDIKMMSFFFFSNLGASLCPAVLPCNLHQSHSWYNTLLILHNSMFLFFLNICGHLIQVFYLLPFFPKFHINNWRITKSLRSCGKPLPTHHCWWDRRRSTSPKLDH